MNTVNRVKLVDEMYRIGRKIKRNLVTKKVVKACTFCMNTLVTLTFIRTVLESIDIGMFFPFLLLMQIALNLADANLVCNITNECEELNKQIKELTITLIACDAELLAKQMKGENE